MEENEGALLLYGMIAKRIEKLEEESERLKWNELYDEISIIFDVMQKEEDKEKFLPIWYEYFTRLYYRVKKMDTKQSFNTISKTERDSKPMFEVKNYDFKMFVWCLKKKECLDYLTNDYFLVPESVLTPTEKKHFEQHCI